MIYRLSGPLQGHFCNFFILVSRSYFHQGMLESGRELKSTCALFHALRVDALWKNNMAKIRDQTIRTSVVTL